MTKDTENFIGSGPDRVDRHSAGISAGYSADRSSAADLRALGAADSMWQKVDEDLEKIDQAEIEEMDDE